MLSIQRPDIFAVLEGHTDRRNRRRGYGRGGHGCYLSCTAVHPLVAGRHPSTTSGRFRPRQPWSTRSSELGHGQAEALLVATLACDERGTRGDGQKAIKELEQKLPQGHRRNHPRIAGGTGGHYHGTGRSGQLNCGSETPAQQADRRERTRHRAALQETRW